LTGWGAHCNGVAINGKWTVREIGNSINYFELQAAYYGLRSFGKDLRHSQIIMRIDNTTALNYINRMCSIRYPHLHEITKLIWEFWERRSLWLYATYIINFLADAQSRLNDTETEWSLSSSAFSVIQDRFGPFDVDLFASSSNHKCLRFISWKPDPFACGIDAFTLNWNKLHFYAFPPFSLIIRTLQKIKHDKSQGLLVVPL